jgi:hypothetical protein
MQRKKQRPLKIIQKEPGETLASARLGKQYMYLTISPYHHQTYIRY